MRIVTPDFSRGSLRRLDSGPVTVMVYGFLSPLELLGTRGHMPFVTCLSQTYVLSITNDSVR